MSNLFLSEICPNGAGEAPVEGRAGIGPAKFQAVLFDGWQPCQMVYISHYIDRHRVRKKSKNRGRSRSRKKSKKKVEVEVEKFLKKKSKSKSKSKKI